MMVELTDILYVEDDADIQQIAEMALSDLGGLRVTVCSSGAEAVEAFPRCAPQLVLLDVMMPGMDGPTTLKELRGLPGGETVPVVFMTAKVQAHEKAGYLEIGAIGVISKPFDPLTLADDVRQLWGAAQNIGEQTS